MIHTIYCKFENFRKNVIFANSIKRYINDVKKFSTKARFTYINKQQSDFAILRGIYFRETWHMRSFAKIKSSQKFPNLQYAAVSAPKINAEGRYKSLKTVF